MSTTFVIDVSGLTGHEKRTGDPIVHIDSNDERLEVIAVINDDEAALYRSWRRTNLRGTKSSHPVSEPSEEIHVAV
jgi:hypothetical protein